MPHTARVYWDAPTDEHPGYEAVVEDRRWNGFASPRFTEAVARQIVADQATENERMLAEGADERDLDVLKIVSESPLVIHHLSYNGEDTLELYEEIPAQSDGLYPIGAWCWTWMEVE